MNFVLPPPRILVIDDTFGRQMGDSPHKDRLNLCGKYLLRDISDSTSGSGRDIALDIPEPVGDVVFYRGQSPVRARVGDVVENDLAGTLAIVRSGWTSALNKGQLPWAMVLVDLCFY